MKKSKIIIIVFILLLIVLGVIWYSAQPKDGGGISIIIGDVEQIVEKELIYNHPDSISFPAVVRSSGQKPIEAEYKGVELSRLFTSLDVDISNIEKIIFNASDGYRIILSTEEINDPQNVYLTFERDGEYLKSKKQGGNGPFQLVIRRDPFSQRWIKHVNEIILN
jgi:hypothetical protein